ncbi:hypothetical protein, partial [uncultured Bacteroides sp.]|uniref:hypothetical protein n=1 Tax=uncultured Bacteroides sp. TaxID=162156 RepID=UPI0025869211
TGRLQYAIADGCTFKQNAKAFFSIPQKPTENLPISSYLFKKSATFCSFCLKKYENQILFL